MKNFQEKYNSPYCHHIVSIHHNKNPVPEYSGNLFLSGVQGLKKEVVTNYGISSVLTIMDQWTYNYNQMDQKIQKNNLLGNHLWIDLQDTIDCSIYPHFDQAIKFIQKNLQDKNVLVHCHMGISRSSSLVIAFLMKRFKMTLKQAFKHTSGIRDTVNPNPAFWKDLEKFQQKLIQQGVLKGNK